MFKMWIYKVLKSLHSGFFLGFFLHFTQCFNYLEIRVVMPLCKYNPVFPLWC